MIADLQKRLEEKQLTVELTQVAKDYVVDSGYDPVYGARPLRRFLQSKVETAIAKAIISRDLRPRTHLVVDYNGRELTVEPVTIMPGKDKQLPKRKTFGRKKLVSTRSLSRKNTFL